MRVRSGVRALVVACVAATVFTLSLAAQAAPTKATCTDVLSITVHGHHVVADYVTGVGHGNMEWPPAGKVKASGGAVVPGGPGPGFHFPNGFAPGASFCTDSASPGAHPGADL